MQNPELWDRIDHYEFPRGFEAKLTEAGIGWGQRRACNEYLRFVYLTMISGTALTPSGVVDAVWHVHLSYTRDYWQKFCAETLQQDLHHDPGEQTQLSALDNEQYLRTLALYEEEFGEAPPLKVWPTKRLWRRVIIGSAVAVLGCILALFAVILPNISGPSWPGFIALASIFGGGGYALYSMPTGRPGPGGGSSCGGAACGS